MEAALLCVSNLQKEVLCLLFTESLKKNFQFRVVYARGKSVANKHLVLYVLKNGLQQNRLGVSVSKKVGKSVVRSRVTRLIKESYRLTESKLSKGRDIVVIARSSAKDITFHDMERSLAHLLKKQNLL